MDSFLRNVPLFADLADDDLQELSSRVEEVRLAAGDTLFTETSPGDHAYVIKEGELEITKYAAKREILLAVRGSGEVIGELALLEDRPRMATVRARRDSVLLAVHKELLDHLLCNSPTAASALFYTILERWRDTEKLLRQNEKMVQLGILTAGVAHELNNPAAAVRRGTDQLETGLQQFAETQARLARLPLDKAQEAVLLTLSERTRRLAKRPPVLAALERSDRESEVEAWLEAHDTGNPWELAPILVNLELTAATLEELAQQFPLAQLPVVLSWLAAMFNGYNLLVEIGQGAEQIAGIVKAVKSYSFRGLGPRQIVDIHEGLENTLLILRHKLNVGLVVQRQYAPNLPKIDGYAGELSQVWTNLIDNAADALAGHGEITVRTRQEGEWVVVEIEDNGPGIPRELQSQIFSPFFTTKAAGSGSGLGLDISYRIVVQEHSGDIRLFSEPGQTRFQVWLPIKAETG